MNTKTNSNKIGYLGPEGSFSYEAIVLLNLSHNATIVPFGSISEVIQNTQNEKVQFGLVPIENSIEGGVPETLDQLLFHSELFIQKDFILDIHQHLQTITEVRLSEIKEVVSYPHATAQCRQWLNKHLPNAKITASNSTSEASKFVAESQSRHLAAIAPESAAKLFNLTILRSKIEDHHDNQTKFVMVTKDKIPNMSGNDRTTIACFQHSDKPGSLHSIVGKFSARGINLTKLESRPTKKKLGQYCFIIEFEGHIQNPVIADCLMDLHTELASLKFLGSYPTHSLESIKKANSQSWDIAQSWLDSLVKKVQKH
jgi:prephenate dehydratase